MSSVKKSIKLKQNDAEKIFDPSKSVEHITGEVLLARNPCGHKGDIRRAVAIGKDHPAYERLKHLVNVVVFPSMGKRPLASETAGGDLDGDVY